jgi:hypothetical protein
VDWMYRYGGATATSSLSVAASMGSGTLAVHTWELSGGQPEWETPALAECLLGAKLMSLHAAKGAWVGVQEGDVLVPTGSDVITVMLNRWNRTKPARGLTVDTGSTSPDFDLSLPLSVLSHGTSGDSLVSDDSGIYDLTNRSGTRSQHFTAVIITL